MDHKDIGDTVFEATTEASAGAIGAAVGAAIGGAVAGPAGTIGGAAVGDAIGAVFKDLASDVKRRYLSKKEGVRIDRALRLTKEKIDANFCSGKALRDDGFFESGVDERSTAEEIFEGVLIASQREYEEKKLPLMAKLYANIAFDATVSRPTANRLLKLASDLTYRQLVIVKVVGTLQMMASHSDLLPLLDLRRGDIYGQIEGIDNIGIASDVFDLLRRNVLFSRQVVFDPAGINPSQLYLGGYGALLFDLMELFEEDTENEEFVDTYCFLTTTKRGDAQPR